MNDATGMPQRVVVLGGTSELARSLLAVLARRRLEHAVLCGRDVARLAPAAEELRDLGVAKVETERFDVRETSRHDEFASELARRLGEIDLVVIAAGVLGEKAFAAYDGARVAAELETNFTGPASAMTAFARLLVAQGSGRIVVYSSVAGLRVRRVNFVYGAAKAGLDGFAQGLGDNLHGTGVSVLIVRPGFVPTKMTAGQKTPPLSTTPERVSADVLRALETGRGVVTTPQLFAPLFGVLHFVPRSLWRRVPM